MCGCSATVYQWHLYASPKPRPVPAMTYSSEIIITNIKDHLQNDI